MQSNNTFDVVADDLWANVTLSVEGMSCEKCAERVSKTLRRTSGVKQASVDLATGRAIVTVDTTKADALTLMENLGLAGYTARVAS